MRTTKIIPYLIVAVLAASGIATVLASSGGGLQGSDGGSTASRLGESLVGQVSVVIALSAPHAPMLAVANRDVRIPASFGGVSIEAGIASHPPFGARPAATGSRQAVDRSHAVPIERSERGRG